MKIYLAAGEAHTVKKRRGILLSYYDWAGPIPFRKPTFQMLIPTLLKEKINAKKKNKETNGNKLN